MKEQAASPSRRAFSFDAANVQDGAGIFVPAARSDIGIVSGAAPTPERAFGHAHRERYSLGLAALAERHNLRWVDGIVVDLRFDDFAALVDQVVDATSLPTVLR